MLLASMSALTLPIGMSLAQFLEAIHKESLGKILVPVGPKASSKLEKSQHLDNMDLISEHLGCAIWRDTNQRSVCQGRNGSEFVQSI